MALIDFILHIDDHLVTIVNQFGGWSYLILFAIIFIETGLVVSIFARLFSYLRSKRYGRQL